MEVYIEQWESTLDELETESSFLLVSINLTYLFGLHLFYSYSHDLSLCDFYWHAGDEIFGTFV